MIFDHRGVKFVVLKGAEKIRITPQILILSRGKILLILLPNYLYFFILS